MPPLLLKGKKLGVLVSIPPEHTSFAPLIALLRAAREAEITVYLYCIDDGVRCINTTEIQNLKSLGTHLFGCAYGDQRRQMAMDEAAAYSGLTIVADMVANTDRFISFN